MNNITTSSDLSTKYIKHKGKIWTHTLTCGMKREIDYILINTKWKNSTLNCEAYNTFFTVGSDHRILTTKLRLSLRQSKSSTVRKSDMIAAKFLLTATSKNFILYTAEVNNRFQAF